MAVKLSSLPPRVTKGRRSDTCDVRVMWWPRSGRRSPGPCLLGKAPAERTRTRNNASTGSSTKLHSEAKAAASPQSKTPVSVNFQQAFNAPGSPWVTLLRNQVYGDAGALEKDNQALAQVLGQ